MLHRQVSRRINDDVAPQIQPHVEMNCEKSRRAKAFLRTQKRFHYPFVSNILLVSSTD